MDEEPGLEEGLQVEPRELAQIVQSLVHCKDPHHVHAELERVCTQLVLASEHSLSKSMRALRSLAYSLVSLLSSSSSSPWSATLATRAITSLAEIAPPSQRFLVHADLLPLLVRQLRSSHAELAEQSLEAVHKLGTMHGEPLVHAGALDAALSCIHLPSLPRQRAAARAVCSMVSMLSFTAASDASYSMQHAAMLLSSEDTTLISCGVSALHSVVQACQPEPECVSRIFAVDGLVASLVALALRQHSDEHNEMLDLVLDLLRLASNASYNAAQQALSHGALRAIILLVSNNSTTRLDALRAAHAIVTSDRRAAAFANRQMQVGPVVPDPIQTKKRGGKRRKLHGTELNRTTANRWNAHLQSMHRLRLHHQERQQADKMLPKDRNCLKQIEIEKFGDVHLCLKVCFQCAAEDGEAAAIELANHALTLLPTKERWRVFEAIQCSDVMHNIVRVLSSPSATTIAVRPRLQALYFIGALCANVPGASRRVAKVGLASKVLRMRSHGSEAGQVASEVAQQAELDNALAQSNEEVADLQALCKLTTAGDKQAGRELARRIGSGDATPSEILSSGAIDALLVYLLSENRGKRMEAKLFSLVRGCSLHCLVRRLADTLVMLESESELHDSFAPTAERVENTTRIPLMKDVQDFKRSAFLSSPQGHRHQLSCTFARDTLSVAQEAAAIDVPWHVRQIVGGERGQRVVQLMAVIDGCSRMLFDVEVAHWEHMECNAVVERVQQEQEAEEESHSILLRRLGICGPFDDWLMQLAHRAPFLISMQQRLQMLARGAADRKREVYVVTRGREREDADNVLLAANQGSSTRVDVQYRGEEGTGTGPTDEFFCYLSKSLCGETFWRENANVLMFPKPVSELSQEERERAGTSMRTLGRAVARAIVDDRLLDMPISRAFCRRFVLQRPLTLKHLAEIEPELAHSLRLILRRETRFEHLPAGLTLSHADAKHSVQKHSLQQEKQRSHEEARRVRRKRKREEGQSKMEGEKWNDDLEFRRCQQSEMMAKQLDDAGPDEYNQQQHINLNAEVTWNTAGRYVREYVDHLLGQGVEPHCCALQHGIRDILEDPGVLQAFNEDELVQLLCGTCAKWSYEELSRKMVFTHGFSSSSPQALWLLQVLTEMESSERRAFLQWLTGAPRLPPGGINALHNITVVKKCTDLASFSQSVDCNLPSVQACSGYLKLPEFSSKAVLRERLHFAIREGGGFHLS